ncbi:hypothetical protein RCOM_0655500 [Ricinus communis]|uniref:Uncharacterized protein n=1 Tax=Ricinus communis TaxID=3988 RepID=B9S5X2_RICCO|nr:hypothetical protein RCOM_0655500 [Ricinus communis]
MEAFMNTDLSALWQPQQSFVNGGGLPGQAFFNGSPTLVCIPSANGVVELEEKQMPSMKEWLDELKDAIYEADDSYQKDALGLRDGNGKKPSSQKIPTSLVDESGVYGRDADKEAITKVIFNGSNDIDFISIMGMGGVEKTNLAQLLYNDSRVQEWFDLKAMMCVSKEFDVCKALGGLLRSKRKVDEWEKILKSEMWDLGYKFKKEDLILLWMAEGFLVQSKGNKELEGVCENSRSKNDKKTRHLSYVKTYQDTSRKLQGIYKAKCLRTLIPLGFPWTWCLRALSLPQYTSIDELQSSIGNLKLLRYLNTLILSKCKHLVELPTKIERLINLHHLDIRQTKLQKMPLQLGRLKNLQVLTDFFIGKQCGSSIKKLGELQYLCGELFVWNLQNVVDPQEAMKSNLNSKKDLKGSHANLEDLSIVGYNATKFLEWAGGLSLSNVVSLTFGKVVSPEFYRSCSSMMAAFRSLEVLRFFLDDILVRVELPCCKLKKQEIVLLWMAEGFLVQFTGNKEMEKIGYEYFHDLLSRSFLQPISGDESGFIMHDLLNDLAVSVSSNFYFKLKGDDSCNMTEIPRDLYRAKFSRTLLPSNLFSLLENVDDKQMHDMIRRLKHLRVLSFSGCDGAQKLLDSDALRANLKGKKHLKELKLVWDGDTDDSPQERDVLEQLQPHTNLERIKYCSCLPSLGQLPSLEDLYIAAFDKIVIVGPEFHGNCKSMEKSFRSLKTLKFERMPQWREWKDENGAFHLL